MRFQLTSRQLMLIAIGLVLGAVISIFITFKAFGLDTGMAWGEMKDAITAIPDYQAILFVNALIGVSVVLLVVELRSDALRVLLTVVVALIFGYLMTAFFNLDASQRFVQGDFRVKIVSDAPSLIDINYEEEITAEFNNPRDEEPLTSASYRFSGSAGDEVSILAHVEDDKSGLNMQVTLLDANGDVLVEGLDASDEQMRTFRRYLETETDAVIEAFALPADGIYTIVAQPEDDSLDVQAEFTVNLLSDNPSRTDLVYGGEPIGDTFNKENVASPVTEATYRFVGHAGDEVTVLAYVLRPNIAANLEVQLWDSDGNVLTDNQDASDEQLAAYGPDLKSTSDAIIEKFALPADGVYSIFVRPEQIDLNTKLDETISATNDAYNAFLLGPLSRINRWIMWIKDALTLIILGLSIAIVFRAEQFSLGAEGQLYFGALASGAIGLYFGDLPKTLLVPVALLSAATAGFLWGLLPGALKAYLGANELVSTLMLNTIAQRFYEMVLTFQLQPEDAGYTASDWIPSNGLLTPIININDDMVTIAVFILIFIVLATWVLIQRTPIGYEIRMIGANIKFADYGGVNTKRTIMLVMAISGAVAGLAGAHLAMGIHRKLILNISIGLAFEGVVVALLARNNPLVAPFTGLLYAYLRTGAQAMERDANISAEVVRIIQAVIILLITAEALVTLFQRRRIRRRGTLELGLDEPDSSGGSPLAPTDPTQEVSHV